jgi:hypothetical protein
MISDLPAPAPPTDADIMEAWDERAAIHEHEGKLSRTFAETKAAMAMRRKYGRVPKCVTDAMKETR